MPEYNFTVLVPANTPREDPVQVEMDLTRGMIAGGLMMFPAGCHGMVHMVICDGVGQLYPANGADTYHGDDAMIPIVGKYKLDTAPYKLYLYAWSPDTDFNHSIQVAISVLSEEEVSLAPVFRDFTKMLKRLLGIE